MRLITHSGSFHADDVLAYAVLSGIAELDGATLVRTRDPEVLSSAEGEDVVFDVGFEFDPERRRFDHHMSVGKPMRDERDEYARAIPYSSVGLIWRYFGSHYLLDNHELDEHLEFVWDEVDKSMILPTDMTDNGMGTSFAPTSLAVVVDDFNLAWDDLDGSEDDAFVEAARYARGLLDRRILRAAAVARAFDAATTALEEAEDPRVVVLPRPMPWEDALFRGGFDEALYVISEKDGTWYCSAVKTKPGSFDQRKPLPAEWAGLNGDDLAQVSGVENAVFCHAARFVCGAGSLEGAIRMATIAADYDETPASRFR
jgi:uncharacterized UPF0160 family protein